MARYRGPKAKIARRFKEPIFGPSKAFERKKYGPGQHGRNRRSKQSNYAVQLTEKQKTKYTYGLLEKQFRNLFVKATRRKGVTGEIFLQLLESRLDNTVYRMGFAGTRRAARQLVNHKHITVNGDVMNIPSMLLRPGDIIEVRVKSKALEVVKNGSRNNWPWLQVDPMALKGSFLQYPERDQIPENIKESLIVELYSK
jgi:small subunit ribosomal protein S4